VALTAPETLALRGRRDECARVEGLLEGARGGRSGVLVIGGEAGVGKTALLEFATQSALGLTIVRVAGVESEMELAFAGLHQFCAPMLDRLERLPKPQRDALETTFGLGQGGAPDRFIVGLAVLSLLSEVAVERPVLCVVDDAQWLDQASAQAFAFVARRLLAEPVVMLFAAREPSDELTGLPQLIVEGLRGADARELLASVISGPLDERVVDQIIAEARGNPLALLELPRALSPGQMAGGFGLLSALPIEVRLQETFRNRLEALPDDTGRLLLLAAAEPTGDPDLLRRAAKRIAVDGGSLEPAESAGLIEVDVRVRFRHPLVRSAVYRSASPRERRGVHRALAEETDARADPDRRAWHLAEASAGPDEQVAAELERAAARAQARGGLAAAAAFLERAAQLTLEPSRRAPRSLAAARTKFEAGALDDALALLSTVDAGSFGDGECAQVDLLRAEIAFAASRGSDAPPLLLKAARTLEAVDAGLARATYLEALSAALFAGRLAQDGAPIEVSRSALAGPPPPQPPRPSDLLLQGLAVRVTEGYVAGAPFLKQAVSAFQREPVLPPQEARWLLLACWSAADLWDDESWTHLSTRGLEHARNAGALSALPLALEARAWLDVTSGDLAAAALLVEEMRAVTDATATAAIPYCPLWLAAVGGQEAELARLIESTIGEAVARGEGYALADTELARAVLYNGLGRFDEALAACPQPGGRTYEIGSPTRTVAEAIEAAVRSGRPHLAGGALERLREIARASGTDWALGVEARSRALLSDGRVAEQLYTDAIERLARTRVRVDLARAHLVYGEWLRRERRRQQAREQLRIALEMFTSMGTEAFAGRAERELVATGERVRKRDADNTDYLTPQETQIARLARDGLSNREIGARLFLSQHTIAAHLREVFSKLGITSRNQLGLVLPPDSESVVQ
jgi:DNA-binding CsgD family transcriptional regulator/tetratricopeptide (TPR) repeat protein